MEYTPEGMDRAAQKAEGELELMLGEGLFTPETFFTWYAQNYLGAGHKRLGRLFVKKCNELKQK